jgi:hypothetical protein
MKKKRTRFLNLNMPAGFSFIRVVLLLVVAAFFVNAYLSVRMLEHTNSLVKGSFSYLVWQLNFGTIIVVLLITLTFILHRGFGALARINAILDQIIKGDYSQRIYLRKKDFLQPFIAKVNKLLDILEKSSPKK